MSILKLSVIGNGSAVPTSFSNPSSQLLTNDTSQFMFDCGEGTQMQMIKHKIRHRKLDNIFISHLHGDHFYGLIGLISTFNLFGREKDLNIYAPEALVSLLEHLLEVSNTSLHFKMNIIPLEYKVDEALIDTNEFSISCFPLQHSVPTWGFVYREKERARKISKEFVAKHKPSPEQIIGIKNGDDFIDTKGKRHLNIDITIASSPPLSYAYCSDTMYDESILEYIEGVSLLYHEATFDDSLLAVAQLKKHSTASQAAMIARKANAKHLLLGHYSARFNDTELLLKEAKNIFLNSQLSVEGKTYIITN